MKAKVEGRGSTMNSEQDATESMWETHEEEENDDHRQNILPIQWHLSKSRLIFRSRE